MDNNIAFYSSSATIWLIFPSVQPDQEFLMKKKRPAGVMKASFYFKVEQNSHIGLPFLCVCVDIRDSCIRLSDWNVIIYFFSNKHACMFLSILFIKNKDLLT